MTEGSAILAVPTVILTTLYRHPELASGSSKQPSGV